MAIFNSYVSHYQRVSPSLASPGPGPRGWCLRVESSRLAFAARAEAERHSEGCENSPATVAVWQRDDHKPYDDNRLKVYIYIMYIIIYI